MYKEVIDVVITRSEDMGQWKDLFGGSLYTLWPCTDHVVMFVRDVAPFTCPLPTTSPTPHCTQTTTQPDTANNTNPHQPHLCKQLKGMHPNDASRRLGPKVSSSSPHLLTVLFRFLNVLNLAHPSSLPHTVATINEQHQCAQTTTSVVWAPQVSSLTFSFCFTNHPF